MKKPEKCKACDRALKFCECMSGHLLSAQAISPTRGQKALSKYATMPDTLDTAWLGSTSGYQPMYPNLPAIPDAPSTVVYHGYAGEKASYTKFKTTGEAITFAAFLNSDQIFDCVIPGHFLKKETAD